jgi:erythromycin esterase
MPGRIAPLAVAALISLAPAIAPAQSTLNLDFETRGHDPSLPEGWFLGGPGYEIKLDAAERTSGNVSLRITRQQAQGGLAGAVATSVIPVKLARGKTIRFSGAIKTDDVKTGYAGLWLRVDGPNGKVLAFDNMSERIENGQTAESDRGVKGTTPWRRYTIELPVASAATNVNFGCLHTGDGTARFDALALHLDGQSYDVLRDAAKAALARKPEELEWLIKYAVPFETADAGRGFADLEPVKAMVGDAHIVALGEATHGTAEFFKMKHRLTEFLASTMGFTVFAIEANMPEAFRLNDFVLRGEGDPKELLKGMYFWTWNTQEVLDMILWMRAFNMSGKGRIEFLGFDMQEPRVAADNVRTLVAHADPEYSRALEERYAGLKVYARLRSLGGLDQADAPQLVAGARDVLDHLEKERERLVKATDAPTVDWAIQNARVVVQAVTMLEAPDTRDRSMAENVDWILAQRPAGTRMVLWAHNGHVTRRPGAMGAFLAERHGKDMVVCGFAFHEGRYTAVARGTGLQENVALPSEPGSIEWAFHQVGRQRAILDLRRADPRSPASAWLTEPIPHRNIGAVAMGSVFGENNLAASYDLLIFFDQTSASVLLPPHRRK